MRVHAYGLSRRPERAAIEDVAGAALTVGDENLVRLGNIEHALRLVQPCDRMNSFAGLKINHFHGVAAKRGHKETSAPEIDAEMIDAAFHVDQRDRFDQSKRLLLPRPGRDGTRKQDEAKQHDHGYRGRSLHGFKIVRFTWGPASL